MTVKLGRRCVGAALAIAALPVHAQAPGDTRLPPAGAWNLDYADDSCRLARLFGAGDSRIQFYIERYGPAEEFLLVAAGKSLKRLSSKNKVTIRFGPGETDQVISFQPGTVGDANPAIFATTAIYGDDDPRRAEAAAEDPANTPNFTQMAEAEHARARNIEWLAIETSRKQRVVLNLGNMAKPLESLRRCTRELITHWGIDAERQATLRSRPQPASDPGRWINSSDYPRDLLVKGNQGWLAFRLMVDESGTPTSCHIQKSTRPVGFETAACRSLMRRAKFTPAIDAEGKPVASYFRSSVLFQIAP